MKFKKECKQANAVIEAIKKDQTLFNSEELIERIDKIITLRANELRDQLFHSPLLKEVTDVPTAGEGWTAHLEGVLLPVSAADKILELERGDIEALITAGVLRGHFPRRPRGPWVFRNDLVDILDGSIPEPKQVYEAFNFIDPSIFFFADVEYAQRIEALLAKDSLSLMKRLECLLDGDSEDRQAIPCSTAEYLLGLKAGDLRRLWRRGFFGDLDVDSEGRFYVCTLINMLGMRSLDLRLVE